MNVWYKPRLQSVDNITVSGKGTNSFKVRHDGSAKTVVLTLKITGGMK